MKPVVLSASAILLVLAGACEAVGPGGFGSGCAVHADCGHGLVCDASACQSAFPRTYAFTFHSARVANYMANGENWDAFGGAPDPRAALVVDGAVVCQTFTAKDTFDPVWDQTCEATLYQSTAVSFQVWDMDVSAHDGIGGVIATVPFNDSILKAGGFSQAGGVSLENLDVTVSLK